LGEFGIEGGGGLAVEAMEAVGLQFVEERAAAEATEETHCQQAEQKRSTNHLTFPFSPAGGVLDHRF
jgi:hypothetical protein